MCDIIVPFSGNSFSMCDIIVPFSGNSFSMCDIIVPFSGNSFSMCDIIVPFSGNSFSMCDIIVPFSGNSHMENELPLNGTMISHMENELPLNGTMISHMENELPLNGTLISQMIRGNRFNQENAFLQSGYVAFFVICALLTIILIVFNAHVIYFSARRLVEMSASNRYLCSVVVTHGLLAIMMFVMHTVRHVNGQNLFLKRTCDVLYMSFLGSTLTLLVDRYLFITQGILYDDFVNEKRSNVIIGIIPALSLLFGATVNANTISSLTITRRIYAHLSSALSLAIFGFDLFRNFKIYHITAHALNDQQRVEFNRQRGKRLLVLFVEIIMTIVQAYTPVVTISHLLQMEHVIVITGRGDGRYLKIIQALSSGICVMWYIVTDRKLRDVYRKHALFSYCRNNLKRAVSPEG